MQNEIFELILKHAEKLNQEVFLVGGAVRDFLLNQKLPKDLDFSVAEKADHLIANIAAELGQESKSFPEFLTAKLLLDPQDFSYTEIDCANFRKEHYPYPGSLPVVEAGSFDQDLARRDFSINTLAIKLRDLVNQELNIIDQHSGQEDLEAKQVRILHPKSFSDDPTRIFRAARYKVLIAGTYEKQTKDILEQAIGERYLDSIDSYRILSEIKKILSLENNLAIFNELNQINVWQSLGFNPNNFQEFDLDCEDQDSKFVKFFQFLSNNLNLEEKELKLKSLGIKGNRLKEIL